MDEVLQSGNVLHMKGDEGLKAMAQKRGGNVLHKGDEGQNVAKKRRKCPS